MPTFKNFAGQDIFVSDADVAAFTAHNGVQDLYRIGEAFTPSYGSGAPGAITAPNVHSDGSTGLSPAPVPRNVRLAAEAVAFVNANGAEDLHRLPEALGISASEAQAVIQSIGIAHTDVINAGVGTTRTAVTQAAVPIDRTIAAADLTGLGGFSSTQILGVALVGWGLFHFLEK